MITVTDVKTFLVRPARSDLLVVKVETSEPGLYGLGCATFTQRILAVKTAVDEYLRPLMIGRPVKNIEDAWQVMYGSSYWRNGPVLNNAISGIDEALWDIKGKMANMPVYDLLGGKCREGALTFADAKGNTLEEVAEDVKRHLDNGFRHIRVGYRPPADPAYTESLKPEGAPWGNYIDPKTYIKNQVELFKYLREQFGEWPEYMIDVHERVTPQESIMLAKALEPYHLFFLEDSLAPEFPEWFAQLRNQVSTPFAMGELFNNVNEYKQLIANQQIDYIRCHISQLGGISPAWKLTAFCGFFGVKTAWHQPGDISPVGIAAHLHIDLATPYFGIQECRGLNDASLELFPGAPELRGCYLYANDKPGLGVDFNEELAKKFPPEGYKNVGFLSRLPDGTAIRT